MKKALCVMIVLCAFVLLLCTPVARGDGALLGITQTPTLGAGQATPTPRPTPVLEACEWLPLVMK